MGRFHHSEETAWEHSVMGRLDHSEEAECEHSAIDRLHYREDVTGTGIIRTHKRGPDLKRELLLSSYGT